MLLISLIVLIFLPVYYITHTFGQLNYKGDLAGPFFVETITPEELREDKKIKILLVPGHEADYGGADCMTVGEINGNMVS